LRKFRAITAQDGFLDFALPLQALQIQRAIVVDFSSLFLLGSV